MPFDPSILVNTTIRIEATGTNSSCSLEVLCLPQHNANFEYRARLNRANKMGRSDSLTILRTKQSEVSILHKAESGHTFAMTDEDILKILSKIHELHIASKHQ